jgi:serine/threonine protein kinase
MECEFNRSLPFPDGGSDLENRNFVRRRRDENGRTWKVYSIEPPTVDEALFRLPELLIDRESKTIKSERKVRVVRLPLRIGKTLRFVYVKQYRVLGFWHRLASLVVASSARRALSGSVALSQEGFATPRPVAAVEHRCRGLLIESFYLSEEISQGKTAAAYWREDLRPLEGREGYLRRRATLRALARLFKSLHERRIYHNDLKASNILVRDGGRGREGSFSLIDVQGVRRCRFISLRRKIKNLAQINRSLGKDLSRTEKLFFIKAYWNGEAPGRKGKRRYVRDLLKQTDHQLTRERRRHSATIISPMHQPTSLSSLAEENDRSDRTARMESAEE